MALKELSNISDTDRRRRRKRRYLLLIFAVGLGIFCAAAGLLYYLLQPLTLRIAVGPAGSDDQMVVMAMADVFAAEGRSVRLTPITTEGAVEAVALLTAGKADLAVGRADLQMPSDAQSLAVLRKNYAVLWSFSGSPRKSSKARKSVAKVDEIADLAGHKVGVIGRTTANVGMLKVILSAAGVQAEKVAIAQFATDKIDQLAQDPSLDAFLAVGPLDSKITADAIAATAQSRGTPKFLGIDASDAIALKHPRYESEEIPASVFNAKPAWPDDKVDTISVSHLIIARKALSESHASAFFRQLFAVRELIAEQVSTAAHITKPDPEKDTELPVHRGAAAVINGTERTFLDKYGDYFWFALLLLSALGSAAAWFRRYLTWDEREETTSHRNRILAAASEVRIAASEQEVLKLQREVDTIVGEAIQCYDEGAIDEDELAPFGLVLELFDHAVAERRAALQENTIELVRGTIGTRR